MVDFLPYNLGSTIFKIKMSPLHVALFNFIDRLHVLCTYIVSRKCLTYKKLSMVNPQNSKLPSKECLANSLMKFA